MIFWFEKHYKTSWIITILIAAIIFYISSLTFESVPGPGGSGLKSIFYHVLAFFFLALFLLISLIKGKYSKKLLLFGIVLAIVYGISDEIHQFFVPGRAMDPWDILYDGFGIILAAILYLFSLKPKIKIT